MVFKGLLLCGVLVVERIVDIEARKWRLGSSLEINSFYISRGPKDLKGNVTMIVRSNTPTQWLKLHDVDIYHVSIESLGEEDLEERNRLSAV